ncbi:MAG TPA: hypothetical protein VL989_00185 [Candidatus Sulfotelmatobacter sp.]|nr:hypothetical protein [Candidatus Sulfotelmatobacter sp.]
MNATIPYIAAASTSLCYGTATILEQIGARREKQIVSFRLSNLVGLFKQAPYFGGILLDLVGWGLFLIAVRQLPLFLCLSFVSFSLVVSAILAVYMFKTKIPQHEAVAIVAVMVGIVMLGISAKPTQASHVNHVFILCIELFTIPLAIAGVSILKNAANGYSGIVLAAFSGITFGMTGIISRFVRFDSISSKYLLQLPVIALIAYGLMGMMFLAAALQRDNVNRVNSLLFSAELVIPSVLGILFLGDRVKDDLWPVMIVGLLLVVAGSIVVSLNTKLEAENAK